MWDIEVDTNKLRQYANRLGNVNRRLIALDGRLNGLYFRVGLLGLWKLMQADALTGYSWRLIRCQTYLLQTAEDFETVEYRLAEEDPANFNPYRISSISSFVMPPMGCWTPTQRLIQRTIRNSIRVGMIVLGESETALTSALQEARDAFWNGDITYEKTESVVEKNSEDGTDSTGVLSRTESFSLKPKYGKYKDSKLLSDEDHLDISLKQKKDPILQENKDDNWYGDPEMTLLETKAEAKYRESVFEGKTSGENSWSKGSAEARFLTAEAYANAGGGLYVYSKDKDGKVVRKFAPGVSAETGVGVAVFQSEGEGRIGFGEDKNMLGVFGKYDAELLAAEAKGKIAVSTDEVYAGLKAEANVAKISGTAGVSVLGTDVGVNGSLKVGIGAHAEAGYTDGKLKVDIGVAAGVGFDVGVEVDVSGTVDAVCGAAEEVWDYATDVWEDTSQFVGDALDDAARTASGMWNRASRTAADVWNSVF